MSNNKSKKAIDMKIILLGNAQVGKTTLLLKYLQGEFIVNIDANYAGVNLFRKNIELNDQNESKKLSYTLNIWDIAGYERFKDYFSLLANPIDAVIILVSNDSHDFIDQSINIWINTIGKYLPSNIMKYLFIVKRAEIELSDFLVSELLKKYTIKDYFLFDIQKTDEVNGMFEKVITNIISNRNSAQ